MEAHTGILKVFDGENGDWFFIQSKLSPCYNFNFNWSQADLRPIAVQPLSL
jgi:hypothetical protein